MELQAWIDLKIVPELKKYTVKEFIVVHKDLVDELAERKNVINDTNLKITESKMAKSLMNLKNLSKNKITNVDNVIVTKKQNTKSVKTITAKTSKIETEVTTKVIVDKVRIYWKHPSHQKQDELSQDILQSFIKERDHLKKNEHLEISEEKLKHIKKKYEQIHQLNNLLVKNINHLSKLDLSDIRYLDSLDKCTQISERIERIEERLLDSIKKLKRENGVDLHWIEKTIQALLSMNMSRRAMIENDQKMVEYNMIDKEDDINILNNKLINLLENKEISLDELRENDILVDN